MIQDIKMTSSIFLILILFIGFISITMIVTSQDTKNETFEVNIENLDFNTISITISHPEFLISTKIQNNMNFTEILLENEGFSSTIGQAKLPKIRKMIEIPQEATPSITINSNHWDDTSLDALNQANQIIPVQPLLYKHETKKHEFYQDSEYYTTNDFFPDETVKILEISEIRGRRFALVEISPVLYNPYTGELKLMISSDISIHLSESNIEKTKNNMNRYSTPSYEALFEATFPNYGYYENLISRNDTSEGYLIIVHDDFIEEIEPFVLWKNIIGYNTTVTKTSEIPDGITNVTIRSYIKNAYENWTTPPSYVLLVGDTPQIPTFIGDICNTETDTYFGTMDDDIFADIHIGRFPAATEEHVITMVNKTLYYELGVFPDNEWIKKGAFLASADANQLAEETHNYCIETYLEPNNYTCDHIYQANGGNTWDVTHALNEGASLCIYSGHGWSGGWGCIYFSYDEVNTLTNAGMYPFVTSHACTTAPFGIPECFGETWLRAENKGGIGFWGSSTFTAWGPDDVIQRRMFDAWWNDSLDRIGQMTDKGMYDSYQQYGSGMGTWVESYNVLGDPSVRLWSDDPFIPEHDIYVSDISVSDIIPHGETQTIFAKIRNIGNNTETNINIDFLVNGTIIDSTTIASIEKFASAEVSFHWDPSYGEHLVEIESQSIPDEYNLNNNNVSKLVTVISAPAIEITPIYFDFLELTNSTNIDILSIKNLHIAETNLTYALSISDAHNRSWLSTSIDNGTLEIDTEQLITLNINTTNLSNGNYQGIISITSNDPDDSEIKVYVNLTIVYETDMAAISINNPKDTIPNGSYIINATIKNNGYNPQTDVLINCSIFEGGFTNIIHYEDFSIEPLNWTITHISGTAWSWDSDNKRMINGYGYPNAGYLDSPVINCSSKAGVTLSFWHYWLANYPNATQDGYVRGSIDGGVTFPYLIDEFHHNDPDGEIAVKSYSLEWADNQAEVVIRYDVYNMDDWYWAIDNFKIEADIVGELVYSSETSVDFLVYESKNIEFTPLWDTFPGVYGIRVTTLLPDDEDTSNDAVSYEIIVSTNMTPVIDVNQSVFIRGFPIRHAADGDWGAAQSFLPTMNSIAQVELYMRKFGNPEFDLVVELREGALDGYLIDTLIFTPEEIETMWYWLTLNFSDTIVNSGLDYFIVCPPAPNGVTTSFGYEWGYAIGNQYDDGSFWFTRDGGALWRDLPTSYEFTFKTYGYN